MLALLLAAVGLNGVTAYGVSRRRTEIGIRLALGANPTHVIRLVVSRVALLVGLGAVAGTAASLWLWESSSDFSGVDPFTFVAVTLSFALIAGMAAYIPSRRAASIDPQVALAASRIRAPSARLA